jgi:uncharacterized protein (TIGR03437 family)
MRALLIALLLLAAATSIYAAPPDRITRPVDTSRTITISGTVRSTQPAVDLGPVDPGMQMNYMVLIVKPSAAQQSDLDQLLIEQQNPASPLFRQWLTPEAFGERFGLSTADQARVVAWLSSEGFTINHTARSRNWIAFSGSAAQVSSSLHTAIHRFQLNGESHFSITSDPAVPDALADVAGGFLGLDDFYLTPFIEKGSAFAPDLTSGTSHFLAPADFATIYDVAPLYSAGIDGTGQNIAIVGESEILLSDIQAFRTRFSLPANNPNFIPYTGTSPGFNGAQIEGNLDVEWAGAVAPKATISYIYGPDPFTAIVAAVEMNVAPVISVSYGGCEIGFSAPFYRSFAQQGNAQGITIFSAAGDSGAAGCDRQQSEPFATRGEMVDFPAVLPEVTGVGGAEFVEGSGSYWSSTNSSTFESALSYIPEMAWNESDPLGLGSGGGGASLFYTRPLWQTGPGLPNDTVRHVPDVALSAALHDAYFIAFEGSFGPVGGTSAAAPSMAGIVALLNHYQVQEGFQAKPGLGNINPQLYRLAQTVPAAFHDIVSGTNVVPCAQGSPNCLTGSFGYSATPNYDMATGLGSVDANVLVTEWNKQTAGVVLVFAGPSQASVNDTITAAVTVYGQNGGPSGTPTGTVVFSADGIALGSATLTTDGTAALTFPLYQLGPGIFTLSAIYSGDSVFSGGGVTKQIVISTPTNASAIVITAPNTVLALPPDAQGLSWQTPITLHEIAGVAAVITGFSIDGQPQNLQQYFPSAQIPASGTVETTIVFRNLATPVTRTFAFSGIDSAGQNWTRQVSVIYYPLPPYINFNVTASPLIVTGSSAANSACQWPVQVHIDELGGYASSLSALYAGSLEMTPQIPAIFGTTRLEAWGSLTGTVCFNGVVPPSSNYIQVNLSNGDLDQILVEFANSPANPVTLSATPAQTTLTNQASQATVSIGISDETQSWNAAVYPANPTTGWLTVSQLSGTGQATMSLTASGTGFEPGVYRANLVIQSLNAAPQSIVVPILFVNGGPSNTTITGIADPASYQTTGSAGMILSVFGSNLASTTQTASGNPLPYTIAGVTAAVNGVAAPLLYVSPNQINLQVPYSVGSGPAVLGINNNGQIAGFAFSMAAAAPGVFGDSNGNLVPQGTVAQGSVATLYVNGVGDVPALLTGTSPATNTPVAHLPTLALPMTVTVGGAAAFIQFAGIPPGEFGVAQVNFTVPTFVPPGPQPVVVTINGVSSPPVNLTVSPPVPASTQ